jgi:hypothetical protein
MSRRRRVPLVPDLIRRMKRVLSDQLAVLEGEPEPEDDSARGTATRRRLRAARRNASPPAPAAAGRP